MILRQIEYDLIVSVISYFQRIEWHSKTENQNISSKPTKKVV